MTVRKIAKWYGLRWSNRLEKLMPRFERDLLVLSNRTIKNYQVAFDDKIQALDNIRTEFETPKYYEGLCRLYGTFQLFSRMTDSLKEMQKKGLPIGEAMRDILHEYALVRPINPENEESAKQLVKTFKTLCNIPVPLATESGDRNVTLNSYIQLYNPKNSMEWTKLTGVLAISEHYNILVEAVEHMKKEKVKLSVEVYDRVVRALILLERPDDALALVEESHNAGLKICSTQLVKLFKLLSSSKRQTLASCINIKAYKDPDPWLMQFVLQNQKSQDLTSVQAYKEIKNLNTSLPKITERNYTILLDALAKENNIKAIEELWDEMLQKKIYPSSKAYLSLMTAYCAAGDHQKVVETWNSAYCKAPNSSMAHINVLLTSCIKHADYETLKDHWEKVKMYGYRLGLSNYSTYLEGLIEFKKYDEILEVFNKQLCHYSILKPDAHFRANLHKRLNSADIPSEKKNEMLTQMNDAFTEMSKIKLSPKFQ